MICAPKPLVVPTKPLVAFLRYSKGGCAGRGFGPFKVQLSQLTGRGVCTVRVQGLGSRKP